MLKWRCGDLAFELDRPLVMGILNVTPDSFSDGGLHEDADAALTHARAMIAEGADIVDVGGESTRPGSEGVSTAEELERVLPVVETLARERRADGRGGRASGGRPPAISIDTRHAQIAAACLAAGANIINDVSGFRDSAMVEVAAHSDAGVIVMHMLGEPGTMQDAPSYDDVVSEVIAFLRERATVLEAAGVERERIAVDPGIGFGKTLEHNLELLSRLGQIAAIGYPVVVGASRKRFIGAITGQDIPADRLEGSLSSATWSATHGASVVRVHDVAETVRALAVTSAIARFGETAGRE